MARDVIRPSSFTHINLNRIHLTSAVDTDSGQSSEGGADVTTDSVEEIKASVECVKLIWQHGLT